MESLAIEHWTLRGLDGEVLRISAGPENRSYRWQEDYVYGDGRLLASVDAEKGRRSLLLDHLGSVRRVVTPSGVVERSQDFYAFGQEATTPTSDDPALKYTGHKTLRNLPRHVADRSGPHSLGSSSASAPPSSLR